MSQSFKIQSGMVEDANVFFRYNCNGALTLCVDRGPKDSGQYVVTAAWRRSSDHKEGTNKLGRTISYGRMLRARRVFAEKDAYVTDFPVFLVQKEDCEDVSIMDVLFTDFEFLSAAPPWFKLLVKIYLYGGLVTNGDGKDVLAIRPEQLYELAYDRNFQEVLSGKMTLARYNEEDDDVCKTRCTCGCHREERVALTNDELRAAIPE